MRKTIKGKCYRRGVVETRGAKKILSNKNLAAINKARKTLIKKAGGCAEVTWEACRRKARAPKADATTVARSMAVAGYDIKARRPRERPQREKWHEEDRVAICKKWMRYPVNYFNDDVDMILDNKRYKFATFARAVKYMQKTKVRFHLRTREEGLKKGFTKPSLRKQKMNPGGSVQILAGISRDKVVLWHNVGKSWGGAIAANCYRGPVMRALKKHCGEKDSYRILEDNDPSGYKTKIAEDVKKELGIKAIAFPRHSPDLNPLDFFLWDAIDRKMRSALTKPMSAKDFAKKLARVARTIPAETIHRAVASIRTRAKAVVAARGGDIPRD